MSHPEPAIDSELLVRLSSGLRILALRRLRDADSADEAVQEILARTLELVRDGRVPRAEELAPIAYGIARHIFADENRKRVRSQRILSLSSAIDPPAPAYDVLAPLIAQEERRQLRLAWNQLSRGDRDILRLTFFQQIEPSDLARRLGEPAERMRKRKSRALARLRAAFFAQGARPAAGDSPAHAASAGHGGRGKAMYDVTAVPLEELG